MKILHLLNELRFSGAEVLLTSAAEELKAGGLSHTIVSMGSTVGEYAPQLEAAGYKVVHIPFSKSPMFFFRLWAFVRAGRFDGIHIHAERANFWTALIALTSARRVVRTLHNAFPFEGNLRRLRGWQRQALQRMGVIFVACSDLVRRNEKERFGIDARVVWNWMDPGRVRLTTAESRRAARVRLDIPEDAFCIVSLGNYGPAKNQQAIVAAVRSCAPDFEVLYLHCGSGGSAFAAATNLSAEDPVRLMGPMQDIADVLTASDAFVSASFFEGGQISLLEAGMAGAVCITTKAGLAEEFEGVPNVVFVEPTAESLEAGMRAVHSRPLDERLADAVGISGFVAGNFVPSIGAPKYVAIYRGMINEPTSPAVRPSTVART